MSTFSWLQYQWAFTSGAILLAVAAIWLLWIALLRDRSRGRRRCPKCWYDMSGVPTRKCPECGREAKSEQKLFATRRRWLIASAGVFLAVSAVGARQTPVALEKGIYAATPIPLLNIALRYWREEGEQLYSTHIRNSASVWGAANGTALSGLTEFERLLIASRIQPLDSNSVPSALQSGYSSELERAQLSGLGAEMRPALPLLVEYSKDTHPEVRRYSVELIAACAQGGSLEGANALLYLCKRSEDLDVQVEAINRLVWSAIAKPQLRPVLREATKLEMPAAGIAVQEYCRTAKAEDVGHVRRLLAHSDPQIRSACLEGFRRAASGIPESLIKIGCELLETDESGSVRLAAARLAKQRTLIGESQWIRAIERAAQDPEPSVQKECFTLLSTLISTSVEAQEAAKRAITSDAAEQYRAMLVFHISLTMGESRIDFLRSVADRNSSGIVRAVAVRELLTVSGREGLGVEYFVGLLSDQSPEVVHAAAICLGRLGEESRPFLDSLNAVRLHPNVVTQAGIENAIRRIETGEWIEEP